MEQLPHILIFFLINASFLLLPYFAIYDVNFLTETKGLSDSYLRHVASLRYVRFKQHQTARFHQLLRPHCICRINKNTPFGRFKILISWRRRSIPSPRRWRGCGAFLTVLLYYVCKTYSLSNQAITDCERFVHTATLTQKQNAHNGAFDFCGGDEFLSSIHDN